MRLLNKVLVTTSLLITLSGCGQKSFEELMDVAQKKVSAKEFSSAAIDLKNAIIIQPQDASARFKLGRVYLSTSDYSEAEKELVKAKELGIAEDEIETLIVKAIFYQNDFERVTSRVEKLSEEQRNSKVNLFNYLSNIKSITNFSISSPAEKTMVDDDLLIAQSYYEFAKGNLEQAMEITNTFKNNDDEQLEKNILLGLLNAQMKRYESAISAFEKAIKLAPNYYLVYFKLAEVYILANKISDAETLVNKLLTLNSSNAYSNFLMAQVKFRQENFSQAFSHAEKATQNGIDSIYADLIAGISAYKTDRLETSYRHLNKIHGNLPKDHIGRTILIQVKMRLGYTNEAIELINDFYAEPDIMASIYSEIAEQTLSQGNTKKSKEYLEKSVSLNPENVSSLLKQGFVQLSDNDFDGIATLKKVIDKDPMIEEAWMLLTQAYVQKNEIDKAIETAKQFQQINPANGLNLEAYIYLQLNKPEKAKPLLEKSLEHDSELPSSKRFLMLMYAKSKMYEEARKIGEDIVRGNPNNLQYIIEFSNIMIDKEQEEKLETFLKNQILATEANRTAALNIGLALLYQHQGKLKEAVDTLKPYENTQDVRVLFTLGNIQMITKQYGSAAKTFNSIVKLNNKLINAWIQLLESITYAGQYQLALEKNKEALAIFPNDMNLKFRHIRLLIKNQQIEDAKKQIHLLVSANPNELNIKLLTGELAIAERKFDQAVRDLSEYYTIYPSFETAKTLAHALEEVNRPKEGATYLETELNKLPSRFIETHYVAEYLANNKLYEKSAEYYEAILKVYPDHFVTLNNYANVLIKMEHYEHANEIATKALQINPTSPFALDTVGWTLFVQNKPEESFVYIKKANEILPSNVEIQFHLIENYIKLRDISNANAMLKKISPKSTKDKQTLARLKSML